MLAFSGAVLMEKRICLATELCEVGGRRNVEADMVLKI